VSTPSIWRPGAKILHPYNPELGVGLVRAVDGRFLVVWFPEVDREITLAAERSGLRPLVMPPGSRARVIDSGEDVVISEALLHSYKLNDGREIDDSELWPLDTEQSPIERLAQLRVDKARSFRNRIEGLRLGRLREAEGLGPFLGGRIELYPHQLHTAERAVESDPVRWLLTDEVGLGKTIEACLILSALVRTGRAERALVVAPNSLVVQWLGELYRKFHQVFVLLDEDRIESVESDYGEGVNPFEVHPYAVISLEMLAEDENLQRLALESDHDLVVVDEAHWLGDPDLRAAVAPLVEHARHALLLTATPLQADRTGFYGLVSLLHAEEFPTLEAFDKAVDSGKGVFPCTSAVTRDDIGGLPPRMPVAVELPAATDAEKHDVRAVWIAEHVRGWLDAREKVLVFVHDGEELQDLKRYLEARTHTAVSEFHADMSVARRDIEVARFRETTAPVILCSDAGAEGRNFQFCTRMIHWDLPLDPVRLEQRIGRLDRIGRKLPVEIVYFKQPGQVPDIATLYEDLDLFSRPSAGLDAALGGVREALEGAGAEGKNVDSKALARAIEVARKSTGALPSVFYPDAYDSSRDEAILSRIPPTLQERMQSFCLGAAEDLGLIVVEKTGKAMYFMELGTGTRVEGLAGVPDDARYLGTFDREEAVEKDEIEFFSSGHPLVEGLLLELADGNRGRAALLEAPIGPGEGAALVGIFTLGPRWGLLAVDLDGRPQPKWAQQMLERLSDVRGIPIDDQADERWGKVIRGLGDALQAAAPEDAELSAVAFVRLTKGPRRS